MAGQFLEYRERWRCAPEIRPERRAVANICRVIEGHLEVREDRRNH